MALAWTSLGQRSTRCTQLLNEAAPSAREGVQLGDLRSVTPIARLEGVHTFTGTGALLGYLYSDTLGRWVRAPRADLDLSEVAGLNEVVLPTLPVVGPRDIFALVASSVGATGGTSITIDFYCVTQKGEPV